MERDTSMNNDSSTNNNESSSNNNNTSASIDSSKKTKGSGPEYSVEGILEVQQCPPEPGPSTPAIPVPIEGDASARELRFEQRLICAGEW